ncbi:DUF1488 family protein [Paraburkholderia sacchari]|uniref:DUF1488 family protein n=1 Tax=Paraburkholderia sacchari TaxID=159450 RepID=UPI001BCAAC86|nr:DUF1488 family protein [Paraburkholderia sacchari]
MTLNFPDPNRAHNASRRCFFFSAYDIAREIVFMADNATLTNLNPGMASDEAALLAVFDRSRDQILVLGRSLYKGGR